LAFGVLDAQNKFLYGKTAVYVAAHRTDGRWCFLRAWEQ